MKAIFFSAAFRRDLRRMKKRGKDMSKLELVVNTLAKGDVLSTKHKPHALKGSWHPKWDCHVEPDWVLIYETTANEVRLTRTGTHSDLFKF